MTLFFPEDRPDNALESEPKTGVLLINLGSPEAATARALRPYLAQFLSDRRIVEMSPWKWRPILHGIVLPLRPRRSAALYRKIWTSEGAPLLVHCRRLAEALQSRLGLPVFLGMTYGEPAVATALREMKKQGLTRVVALPLYPQYASSSAGAALDALWRALLRTRVPPEVITLGAFYRRPAYVRALAQHLHRLWAQKPRADFLLLSFHGIPRAQHEAGDVYVAQCYETARMLARILNLSEDEYRVSFQSRFGRTPWIEPSTQEVLARLPECGVLAVDVASVGFVCDCLETLEEIAISGRKIFEDHGGKEFRYLPCLNDDPDFVDALAQYINEALPATKPAGMSSPSPQPERPRRSWAGKVWSWFAKRG